MSSCELFWPPLSSFRHASTRLFDQRDLRLLDQAFAEFTDDPTFDGEAVWIKNHTGMGAFYRSRHELVFVFKHGHAPHRNNVQLGKYGRDRTNVWNYSSPRTPSEEGNLLALHPTVKPVRLVADAIWDCSARGDIVLDSFLGSGTTVIAAERTGRRCFGLEIDPLYLDTILRRWQAYTGASARHAPSGRSFDELEAERGENKRNDR